MADGVFGKFEQVGPIRVSQYSGPGAAAEPKGVSGLRIAGLTSLVFLLMVIGGRFTILAILENSGSALYQRVLPLTFFGILIAGLYIWALIVAIRSKKAVQGAAQPILTRGHEVPSDAVLAVVRMQNMKSTKGWVWIQNGKLWFSGEYFWFCLGPSDFRSKNLFRDHGSPLKLPKGLCLRQIKIYIFEPDGKPLAKQISLQFQNRVQAELYDDSSNRAPTVFPPLSVPSEPVDWGRVWAGSIAVAVLFTVLGTSLYFVLPSFDGMPRVRFLSVGLTFGMFPLIWPLMVLTQDVTTREFAKDEAKFRKRVQTTK